MSLLDSLKSIFGKKDSSVLGVDIGSSSIKVVQIRKKKGRAVLETYGELALGPYASTEIGRATNLNAQKLGEAVNDILREASTTTHRCGIALPMSSSLIAFISVPHVENKQLADVIALEARKYIPVPMNEVILDWSVIPKEEVIDTTEVAQKKDGKEIVEVLAVAIHNESISHYQAIMAETGLQSSFFEIELFASIRGAIDQGIHANMILDMGASSTKLYIVERGILRTSHIINKGSQDITLAISKALSIAVTEAESNKRTFGLQGGEGHKELADIITLTLDYIFYETNRVLLNYQKKYNKNVTKIILTGGGVLLKGFGEAAKTSFQTEIVYANPFSKLETPAFLAEQFKSAGPEFAVAIGVALRRLSEVQ